MDSFDLGSVPTVFALKRKHKTLKDEMMDEDCSKLYRRGAMAPSVAIFENLLDRFDCIEKHYAGRQKWSYRRISYDLNTFEN